MVPAAVTESPSPMTSEELLSGMVTEEVEPGIYRVINDGVRDLMVADRIVVGDDGSVWATRDHEGPYGRGLFRLGDEIIDAPYEAWSVTNDGTLWAESLHTYDGERWTEHPAPPSPHYLLLYNLGGTIWATWSDPQQPQQWAVARLDGAEWSLLDPLLMPGAPEETPEVRVELLTTDGEDLWAWMSRAGWFPETTGSWGTGVMRRWVDGEWQDVFRKEDSQPWAVGLLALGPSGTMWLRHTEAVLDDSGAPDGVDVSIRSFDGSEWQQWSLDDLGLGVRADQFVDVGAVDLVGIGVAPDGSLWVVPGGEWSELVGDGVVQTEQATDCQGLLRFDGERWQRYAQGTCLYNPFTVGDHLHIGPDGSIWALASTDPANDHAFDLYVITPEAVAATE
jgi:hypothetical protein